MTHHSFLPKKTEGGKEEERREWVWTTDSPWTSPPCKEPIKARRSLSCCHSHLQHGDLFSSDTPLLFTPISKLPVWHSRCHGCFTFATPTLTPVNIHYITQTRMCVFVYVCSAEDDDLQVATKFTLYSQAPVIRETTSSTELSIFALGWTLLFSCERMCVCVCVC